MQLIDSFLNQPRSNSAIAIGALADAGDFSYSILGSGQSVEKPSAGAFGDPSLFTIGRGNPDSSFAGVVFDQERPLSVEVGDVAVGNYDPSEGVYNLKIYASENQFWSYPEKNRSESNAYADQQVKPDAARTNWVQGRLDQVQAVEGESGNTPSEVSFGAKYFDILHASIIAGETASRKGKQK